MSGNGRRRLSSASREARTQVLVRDRVIRLIEGESRQPRLRILRGPLGAGKSLAAAQWATVQAAPIAWVSARETAGDLHRFWELTAARLATAADIQPEDDLHRYPSLLSVVSGLPGKVHLVVDDWHLLSSRETDEALAQLLDNGPRLSLVVLGRRFTALDAPLTTARYESCSLTSGDLAFTCDETVALAGTWDTDPGWLEGIRRLVRSWPLALTAACTINLTNVPAASWAEEFLTGSIETLLWDRTDPERRLFAVLSGCGTPMPTAAVTRLSGLTRQETAAALHSLENAGLVLRNPANGSNQVHPALETTAHTIVERELGNEEILGLKMMWARDMERKDPATAARLFSEAGDYTELQRLLESQPRLVLDPSPIASVLTAVPREVLDRSPLLAGARMLHGYARAETSVLSLRSSVEAFRTAADAAGHAHTESSAVARYLHMTAERVLGNSVAAQSHAEALEFHLAETSDDAASPLRTARSLMHSGIALTYTLNGEIVGASRNFGEAIRLGDQTGEARDRLCAHAGMAFLHAVEGNIHAARHAIERIGRRHETDGRAHTAPIRWQLQFTRAVITFETPNSNRPTRLLLDEEEGWGRCEFWPLLVVAEAASARKHFGNADALARLTRARAMSLPSTPYLRTELAAHAANMLLAQGDVTGAERQLHELPNLPVVDVTSARITLTRGQPGDAITRLDRLLKRQVSPRYRGEALVLLAVALWNAGAESKAVAVFERAMAHKHLYGQGTVLGSVPFDRLRALAVHARETGTVDAVDEIDGLPAGLRVSPIPPLTEAERRTLEALRNGKTTREAAAELFISQDTVKYRLKSIYRKFQTANRADILYRVEHAGLLRP
ncbi:hypothetical protein ERC79_17435 [Rhodococcus sp. ABRD24]|uniref:LuxR C-terminal-related transcriptional regulator n=1 Tax=Rhodococcus sp. ABRD24 TaxID=2507582 RepID=UPI00103C3BFA|nr:LuxR C-terminal-related transcriptional regulator [Rhodococcus sp. ABRD24]QBJ97524.1 hypothetical protein ERC79_17435 [Rhodococcus sp. ABRD24]